MVILLQKKRTFLSYQQQRTYDYGFYKTVVVCKKDHGFCTTVVFRPLLFLYRLRGFLIFPYNNAHTTTVLDQNRGRISFLNFNARTTTILDYNCGCMSKRARILISPTTMHIQPRF